MAQKKVYDEEFKIQAVKLGREIGFSKAAIELGVNVDTLYGWNKRAKDARLDLEPGTQTPDTAMSLTEEVQKLRQQTREQAKEIARLKEEDVVTELARLLGGAQITDAVIQNAREMKELARQTKTHN